MAPDDTYPVPPEARVQAGVPQGKVERPFQFYSRIYPGTVRDFWIHVPAKYAPGVWVRDFWLTHSFDVLKYGQDKPQK